jgi:hypothetical protein
VTSLASEFCVDVSEHSVGSIFIGDVSRKNNLIPVILPADAAYGMEKTQCSETSAYKIQMPGNHTKESIHFTMNFPLDP